MTDVHLAQLAAEIAPMTALTQFARVAGVGGGTLALAGIGPDWCIGDRVQATGTTAAAWGGEIIALEPGRAIVLPDTMPAGVALGDRVKRLKAGDIAPDNSWIGRIIDPFGQPLDGRPLWRGGQARDLRSPPPPPARRRRLGARLSTGVAVLDTLLPIVRGQRVGLFAGSGVGKSTLLGKLARGVSADVTVIALIGERGRELRDFAESVLGPAGMARSVIVAATSDMSPLMRRRCAWAAMAVAEYFRDQGLHVLFLVDSITRLAEAHREIALAAGEPPSLRGFPPSTAHLIMSLAERAGPGATPARPAAPSGPVQGDITAVFAVLVAGSDMDEPVADILRGVLDGHIVMDRAIAERGRYPAIDLLRSVSRSLPEAADPAENRLIGQARKLLGAYEGAELMIRSGLYVPGSDPLVDAAVRVWAPLDAFLSEDGCGAVDASFARLAQILAEAGPGWG